MKEGNLTYKFGHFAFNTFFRFGTGWQIDGRENIPQQGPLIVVANHISNWDPPIVGSALNRPVHFMAKKELFEAPVIGGVLNHIGMIPVNRSKSARGAIRSALKILNEGKVLGAFPEGTRSKTGKLKRAKLGIVMIALKAEVPLLPIGLSNTKQPFSEDVKVRIGEPFTLDKYYGKKLDKKEMKAVGREIMSEIKTLIE
ncbi:MULTISPECIES: lysophospholipid acyltransferase family protein [unclassified Candidatus Frackibacter]|uniref:lysophospholipid acyltransferase family protein n=1 Tax=unclassified Candidatus Frackibacter TaxID=2648818 RepID=UPI00088063DA|nr:MULTISPECIES: lysophospholipid acyltransferase family protein [unclassified Candidatus Frackibacter]SDC52157.1 1-acyl-sn-glycerol-3-phosphate acyltransferase [Candidatus Frackibacter sp. WG11]SEM41392.1 1-acyl-sn-glycerol-3-phosphate acyltransferase [Candidatus Frackibacter sp. WG12]SFL76063.1 1-acyl-sn-glycerol-3-phosphate acyltransferase [Candidatus Frackibacter sp. WG13]